MLDYLRYRAGTIALCAFLLLAIWGVVTLLRIELARERKECLSLASLLTGADSVKTVLACRGHGDKTTTVAVPIPIYTR